jgi:GNAT superfamily N-acetyltransferase
MKPRSPCAVSPAWDSARCWPLQQIVCRAFGIWGLILMATAAGLELGPAVLVAAICSLGAAIAGPAVLTVEYEPTPRAFALPLVLCAIGLTAHRRYLAAGIAAACAFLYHPPTALGFLAIFAVLTLRRRQWRAWIPLALAAAILAFAAAHQDGAAQQPFWGRHRRAAGAIAAVARSYIWISAWPPRFIVHHLLLAAALAAAWLRIRRTSPPNCARSCWAAAAGPGQHAAFLAAAGARPVGVDAADPAHAIAVIRALMMQFVAAVAGAHAALAHRWPEAAAWFAVACWLPLQPVVTEPYQWRRIAVLLLVAAIAAAAMRFRVAPAGRRRGALLIPFAGGVVNYPHLHTPELRQLSDWAGSLDRARRRLPLSRCRPLARRPASSVPKPCAPSTSTGKAAAR